MSLQFLEEEGEGRRKAHNADPLVTATYTVATIPYST